MVSFSSSYGGSLGTLSNCTFAAGPNGSRPTLSIAYPGNPLVRRCDFDEGYVKLSGTTSATIDLSYNYWGTSDPAVIEGKIYHRIDDINLPLAIFQPALAPLEAQPKLGSTQMPELDLSRLRQFDGQSWQPVPEGMSYAGMDVVVLNHGWNSSPDGLTVLAEAIAGRLPGTPILSWQWGNGPGTVDHPQPSLANPNGLPASSDFAPILTCLLQNAPDFCAQVSQEIGETKSNAEAQGPLLGQALLNAQVDPQRLHLIGHSFGGVISAQVAKKLSKNTLVRQLTTLDTPAAWRDTITTIDLESAQWIDVYYYNYQELLACSATGGPYPASSMNLFNAELHYLHHCPFPVPLVCTDLHNKIIDWYAESVTRTAGGCDDSPYGFGWSFMVYPNWPEGLPVGLQYEDIFDKGCFSSATESVWDKLVRGADVFVERFESAATWFGQNASLIYTDGSGGLITTAIRLPEITVGTKGAHKLSPTGNPPSYIYKSLQVPESAKHMLCDLRFVSAGDGDVVTVSINDHILLTIDAALQGVTPNFVTTTAAYVGQYAGQTIELKIALQGNGDADSEVYVDAVRFAKEVYSADADLDEDVDLVDMIQIRNHRGNDPAAYPTNDTNQDGLIDMTDLINARRSLGLRPDGHTPGPLGSYTASISLATPGPTQASVGQPVQIEIRATFDFLLTGIRLNLTQSGDAQAAITERTANPNEANGLTYISSTRQEPFDSALPHDFRGSPIVEVLVDLNCSGQPGSPSDGLAPGEDVLIEMIEVSPLKSGLLTISVSDAEVVSTQQNPNGLLFGVVSLDQASLTIQVVPTAGDFDGDGDVDDSDVDAFISCDSGPAVTLTPGCEHKDLDQDMDVDQSDFGIFQRCYSGENNPADPGCAGSP